MNDHLRGHLAGMRILIVEDNAILATDLAMTVEDAGGTVAGTLYRLEQALEFTDLARTDVALLDVDLNGKEVFRFADLCVTSAIPMVFHTGRSGLSTLCARYPGAGIVRKPSDPHGVVSALCCALASRIFDAPVAARPDVRIVSAAAS